MTGKYKGEEGVQRRRLEALELAKHIQSRQYRNREERVKAGIELLAYNVFAASQICRWVGLPITALSGHGAVERWGAGTIQPEQFDIAIELAKAGVAGERPKTTIYEARTQCGLSYDLIGGLLGIHKNITRRVVMRIEGKPWT